MIQATRNKPRAIPLTSQISRGVREGALFVFGAIAIYMLISLATYDSSDPGWSHSTTVETVQNAGGIAGAWFADICLYIFGYLAYVLPIMVGYAGWLLYKGNPSEERTGIHQLLLNGLGFVLTIVAGSALAALHVMGSPDLLPAGSGGILGDVTARLLVSPFSFIGATLFLLALFLAGISMFTGLSWFALMDATGRITFDILPVLKGHTGRIRDYFAGRRARMERLDTVSVETKKEKTRPKPRIEPVIKKIEPGVRVEKEKQVPLFNTVAEGSLPPLSLLDLPEPSKNSISTAALEAMSRQVELKLQDFGIEAQVVEVHPGPIITRFELQPAPGVKVSQISNLAKDLARALSAVSVRIVEVIPGKSVVGLEIPNEHREVVRLSEILQSKNYDAVTSPLMLALGKDISGQPVVVDLAKMPHLLVAGTTGSGKSVAINAMILSMLYNSAPKDMRLIMIDPKMLELSIYEGIPHLLAPVVTDMKEAANALRWCVAEMERRYTLMAALGVRNISNYNRKVKEAIDSGKPIPDPLVMLVDDNMQAPSLQSIPYIVVIIDELADMMMMVGKKVEELIARLAQKARASGIHLILATQRPSVDVITGLIKANIPTRIAFQVSSKIDSRTILDQMGAEQLLGHGDMLYLPPGTGLPVRVHGAFVDDHEVHKVAAYLKQAGKPEYIEEILAEPDAMSANNLMGLDGGDAEADPLYDQAVQIVTETRKASISGVQRRLKIGYNRAARMVEEMEQAGIVGPLESNGSREVLAPPPPEM